MLSEWSNVASIVSAVVAVVALAIAAWSAYVQPALVRRSLARSFGVESFDEDQIEHATKNYIPPDCTQLDPSGHEDHRHSVTLREPLVTVMDKLLTGSQEIKHYLLLADSGMGKTSFLLHYYSRNRSLPESKRVRICVIPLGRKGVDRRIEEIENKNNTVLFLDALDEDTKAVGEHRERLQELMDLCADFRRVVVTCRTQFFSSDEEIPRETGIARVGPRKGNEQRVYQFHKLYLAPFTEDQVERYIELCFPWWVVLRRRKAMEIVAAIPELSLRPMLLAVLPEMVRQHRSAAELFEIYEFMVESWLTRESNWIEKDTLRKFSECLAVDLFLNRSARGFERVPLAELAALIKIHIVEIERWRLTGRSLLNRDVDGNFKFAHRSIMEYLFVTAFVNGYHECGGVAWTDLMKQLFVSWANCREKRGESGDVRAVLSKCEVGTGLFPIFDLPEAPTRVSKSSLKEGPKPKVAALYSRLGVVERAPFMVECPRGESLYVVDYGSDSVFCIPFDERKTSLDNSAHETIALLRLTHGEGSHQLDRVNDAAADGARNWRAPTLEEMDALFTLNAGIGFLPQGEFYWISDTSATGGAIVVRSQSGPETVPPILESLGTVERSAAKGCRFTYEVYSASLTGVVARLRPQVVQFKALLIRISSGNAHQMATKLLARSGSVEEAKRLPYQHDSWRFWAASSKNGESAESILPSLMLEKDSPERAKRDPSAK